MSAAGIEIFEADAQDAEGIARVHVAAFDQAYGDLPGVRGTEPSLDDRIATWEGILGEDSETSTTFVAETGGEAVGFCLVAAPARDATADEGIAEIVGFYVAPEHQRSGTGTALMERALAELRGANWPVVTLWVLVENEPARAFYARFGFASDGAGGPDARTGRPKMRLRASLGQLG